jgi:hypothetical protein
LELAERWNNITIKGGGSLAHKFGIPFGKESTLGDAEMTHIIEQHNLYIQTTKERIVKNLNDIDKEINLKVNNDAGMYGAGATIREMFMTHLDSRDNVLFHSMEDTSTPGGYILLFDDTNTSHVDTLISAIDKNADAHFIFHSNEKVSIIGIQPRGEQTDFWKKNFAGFAKAKIPTEIDTAHLHGHTDNASEVTNLRDHLQYPKKVHNNRPA